MCKENFHFQFNFSFFIHYREYEDKYAHVLSLSRDSPQVVILSPSQVPQTVSSSNPVRNCGQVGHYSLSPRSKCKYNYLSIILLQAPKERCHQIPVQVQVQKERLISFSATCKLCIVFPWALDQYVMQVSVHIRRERASKC